MFKNILIILLLSLTIPHFLLAEIGIKGGLSVSNQLATDESFNIFIGHETTTLFNSEKISFQVGAFASLHLAKRINIQPELHYVEKGSSFDISAPEDISLKVKLTYIELPVLIVYKVLKSNSFSIGLYTGPYVALNLDSMKVTESEHGTSSTGLPNTNGLDYGCVFGSLFNFNLSAGNIVLDIRFSMSLANTMNRIDNSIMIAGEPEKPAIKNQSAAIMIGYEF